MRPNVSTITTKQFNDYRKHGPENYRNFAESLFLFSFFVNSSSAAVNRNDSIDHHKSILKIRKTCCVTVLFISLVYTVAVVAVDYEEPALRQSLFAAPALQRFVHISTHADDDDNSNDALLQDPTAFLPTEADLYGMTKSESLYGNDEDELPDNGNEYVTPDASSLLSASHPHRRRVYNRAEERAEDMALTAVNHKATHHRHRLRQHHLSAEPTEPIRDTVKCFSCMSKLYEAVWPALAHVYKRPLNFTDDCNADGLASGVSADDDADDDYSNGDGNGGGGSAGGRALLDSRNVPVTHCSTICVGMWEETTVAGVRIRAHIRGCADDVLHGGFNDTVVALYRWMHRDSCRDYRKRELFKLSPDRSDESTVHVCTCYADYCNSRSSSGAAFLTTHFNWASTALATLISTFVFAQQHILSDHWAALR